MRLVIESWGIRLDVSVSLPNGDESRKAACFPDGTLLLSVIADVEGPYRLNLTATGGDGVSGGYELRVEELRKTDKLDSDRIPLETTLERAERLRSEWKTASSHQAIELYQKILEGCRASVDHLVEAVALRSIGRAYKSLDDYANAALYYKQALASNQRGRSLLGEATVLNDIVELQFETGKNREASRHARRALELSRVVGSIRSEARALHTIANVHYAFGDLKRAVDNYGLSLSLFRRLKDPRSMVTVLVDLGYANIGRSDVSRVFDSYNEALSISRACRDPHSIANTLRALGNLQAKLGEQQEALGSFLEALDTLQSCDDRHLKATILGGLSLAFDCVGEKQKAIDYCDQALKEFREINRRWGEAEAELFIGEIFNSLRQFETALIHHERALALFKELAMPRFQAQTLRNIGFAYAALSNKRRAFECYRQSLALTRSGQDQRYQAYTLVYIGMLYERPEERLRALTYYEKALSFSRVSLDPSGQTLALYNIARVERDRGNFKEARERIEEAVTIAESLRAKLASRDSRVSYFASAHQYFELYVDILMRLHKQSPDKRFDVLALEASERARARSLADMLEQAHADAYLRADPQLLQRKRMLKRTLQGKIEHQMKLLSSQYTKDEAAALSTEIREITAEYESLQNQIKATSPYYADLAEAHDMNLKDIQQRAVDDGSVLLEYFLGEEKSYLWAMTKSEIFSYEIPRRADVEALALQVRKAMTEPRSMEGETFEERQTRLDETEAKYWARSIDLSAMLLGPTAAQLNTNKIMIVADGALQYVPFGALPDPNVSESAPVPLIVNHEITCQPSASTLATLRKRVEDRTPSSGVIAVFADPVFEHDDSRLGLQKKSDESNRQGGDNGAVTQALRDVGVGLDGRSIPRLLASRDEADAILALSPRTVTLTAVGFDANRDLATGPQLGRYRIIHFATHGILDNETPELSGLVLSLFDREGRPQDGFLRLKDIYNLDLPADLVVLSACNTALGRQIKGEGLIGLTHGFMYSGAARVMASLWKVDDQATAELIKHFYREMLVNKESPADALRKAQIALFGQRRWRSPYFWAPFVLHGEYGGRIDVGDRASGGAFLIMPAAVFATISLAALYLIIRGTVRRHRRPV